MSMPISAIGKGTCPICGSPLNVMMNDEGELVCAHCGAVLTPYLGYGYDEVAYSNKFDTRESFAKGGEGGLINSREALYSSLHDGGIGSTFNPYETKGNSRLRKNMARLGKLDARARFKDSIDSLEGDVHKAANHMKDEISSFFELPSYINKEIDDMVKYVVRKNSTKLKGLSRTKRTYLGYAVVLSVLEAYGIGMEAKVLLKELFKDEKTIREIISWKSRVTYDLAKDRIRKLMLTQDPLSRYTNYANFLLDKLAFNLNININGELKSRIMKTLKVIIKKALSINMNSGKQTTSFLAGLIYLVLHIFADEPKKKPTQERVAKTLRLGNNSVRENYVEAVRDLMILVYIPTKRR